MKGSLAPFSFEIYKINIILLRAKLINEKFVKDSDPVHDMDIGKIDLLKVYKETVVDGINRWYKFLFDLDLVGKKVTFETMSMGNKITITITKIAKGELPNTIYFYDEENNIWPVNIKGKLIIH
jgi:rRNA pseudouridine-1189 N-methylase Emg1 (Nep1/Mra1 family)